MLLDLFELVDEPVHLCSDFFGRHVGTVDNAYVCSVVRLAFLQYFFMMGIFILFRSLKAVRHRKIGAALSRMSYWEIVGLGVFFILGHLVIWSLV